MAENDGTGAGLLEFLAWAAKTGQMAAATANAWAAAVRQVLAIEGDPAIVDVRELDVDALFDRFETLNRTSYSPGSMTTYRFRSAVTAYNSWLNNEPWKPGKRTVRTKPAGKASATALNSAPTPAASDQVPTPQHGSTPRLVNYSVPLRQDLMVSLSLPADLTRSDADRIANFVRSLAFDTEPAAGSATAHIELGGG
jgi:hypothetical protein